MMEKLMKVKDLKIRAELLNLVEDLRQGVLTDEGRHKLHVYLAVF